MQHIQPDNVLNVIMRSLEYRQRVFANLHRASPYELGRQIASKTEYDASYSPETVYWDKRHDLDATLGETDQWTQQLESNMKWWQDTEPPDWATECIVDNTECMGEGIQGIERTESATGEAAEAEECTGDVEGIDAWATGEAAEAEECMGDVVADYMQSGEDLKGAAMGHQVCSETKRGVRWLTFPEYVEWQRTLGMPDCELTKGWVALKETGHPRRVDPSCAERRIQTLIRIKIDTVVQGTPKSELSSSQRRLCTDDIL
jgi:hypothetical protein